MAASCRVVAAAAVLWCAAMALTNYPNGGTLLAGAGVGVDSSGAMNQTQIVSEQQQGRTDEQSAEFDGDPDIASSINESEVPAQLLENAQQQSQKINPDLDDAEEVQAYRQVLREQTRRALEAEEHTLRADVERELRARAEARLSESSPESGRAILQQTEQLETEEERFDRVQQESRSNAEFHSFLTRDDDNWVYRDVIEEDYKPKTPLALNRDSPVAWALLYVALAIGVVCFTTVLASGFLIPKEIPRRRPTWLILGSEMLPLFTWALGLCIWVCCVSVFRGQGLLEGNRMDGDSKYVRPTRAFKHDMYFIPVAIVGGVMLLFVTAILIGDRMYSRRVRTPQAKAHHAVDTKRHTRDDVQVGEKPKLKPLPAKDGQGGSGTSLIDDEAKTRLLLGGNETDTDTIPTAAPNAFDQGTKPKAAATASAHSSPEFVQAMALARPNRRFFPADYLKFLLITTIPMYHALFNSSTRKEGGLRILEGAIGVHAVPGFILVSGYNSTFLAEKLISRRLARVLMIALSYYVSQMLFIFFMFHVFKPAAYAHMSDQDASFWFKEMNPFTSRTFLERLFGPAFWHLWYLQCLAIWSLLIPFWMSLRHPITLSIAVGCLVSYLPENLHRNSFSPLMALEFFPYFVIGATIKLRGWDTTAGEPGSVRLLSRDWRRTMTCVAVLGLHLALHVCCPYHETEEYGIFIAWRGMSFRTKTHDDQWWYPIGVLGAKLYTCSVVLSLLTLMPTRPSYATRAAKYTLSAYVLHYFVVLTLAMLGWYGSHEIEDDDAALMPHWKVGITAIIAIATAQFLMFPPVARWLEKIVMPPIAPLLFGGGGGGRARSKAAVAGVGKHRRVAGGVGHS